MENSSPLSIIEVKIPKTAEKPLEAAVQFFASFSSLPGKPLFSLKPPPCLSFEIASVQQILHFLIVCPQNLASFTESQIAAQYPESTITFLPKDYLAPFVSTFEPQFGQLKLRSPFYLPLRTFRDLKDTDPLSSVLGTMSKAGPNDFMVCQILIAQAGNWQSYAQSLIDKGITTADGKNHPHPQAKNISKKLSTTGFWTAIRLLTNSPESLSLLSNSFSVYQSDVNGFKFTKPHFYEKQKLLESIIDRTFVLAPKNQVLNLEELASLWHPPSSQLAGIKNIVWGTTTQSEPPLNLPVATDLDEADKKQINFIARTEFKNRLVTFGIKKADRRQHMYIIGKTGTGKSTLIANMAINDLRNNEGLAVIDPHGDLTEILLDYIPSYRINDVCYLDPSETEKTFRLNPLEVHNPAYKELVASSIVAIFYKLYSYTWGPRLEHILRNSLLTLLETSQPTLLQIPDILTNKNFRQKIVEKIQDPTLKGFWLNEFERMSDSQRAEAVSPILNKVGQFVASPTIRKIIGSYHSTVNLEEIMNNGKVLLVNLSQGKIGEDNSALLGAMIITQLQLAAMNRIRIPEEERKDFYLYVDEFQNFATKAFIKILSEARKYRLNLCLTNQYIGQLDEDLQKAIFGNAATLISFVVGAKDAEILSKEFGNVYKPEDLVSLGMYQIAIKLGIDKLTSTPFLATTLPLPRCRNQNRQKVLRVSHERYYR